MGSTYNVRQARGVSIVDLNGRITSDVALHQLIHELLGQGHRNILLNFRDVSHLDSAGIGQLFGCFTSVRSQAGIFKLCNPNERVRNLLNLTMLHTLLEIIENESTAIQSFSHGGAA